MVMVLDRVTEAMLVAAVSGRRHLAKFATSCSFVRRWPSWSGGGEREQIDGKEGADDASIRPKILLIVWAREKEPYFYG